MRERTIRIDRVTGLLNAANWLKDQAEHLPLTIMVKAGAEPRRIKQNRLLWMWNSEVQAHMRDHFGQIASAEEWHEIIVRKLRPADVRIIIVDGEAMPVIGREKTSKYTVKQMAEYLNDYDHYCADRLGLKLTHPDDLYWQALGAAE